MPILTAQNSSPSPSSGSKATSDLYRFEFQALRSRIATAVTEFQKGGMILIGDDGRRENEADLVFHASFASRENVNFAITHARGLLCVSLSHEISDRLGFATAPKLPGDFAHTGFTLSVDARENITSGISASDRAHTIKLMADPLSKSTDFLSPGHVFPVRACSSGLLSRTGHTEAVFEICNLARLPCAATMCEILAEDGEALRPEEFLNAKTPTPQQELLRALPYFSTVDLFWNNIFYAEKTSCIWEDSKNFSWADKNKSALKTFSFVQGLQKFISFEAVIHVYKNEFSPKSLRIVFTNGSSTWDNGVGSDEASCELCIFSFVNLDAPLTGYPRDFCDLSQREGVHGAQPAIRRIVTQFRAFEFLIKNFKPAASFYELMTQVTTPFPEDKEFLLSVFS